MERKHNHTIPHQSSLSSDLWLLVSSKIIGVLSTDSTHFLVIDIFIIIIREFKQRSFSLFHFCPDARISSNAVISLWFWVSENLLSLRPHTHSVVQRKSSCLDKAHVPYILCTCESQLWTERAIQSSQTILTKYLLLISSWKWTSHHISSSDWGAMLTLGW